MPSQDELKIVIKAYDEFDRAFRNYINTLKQTSEAQKDVGKTGKEAAKGLDELYKVLGQLGVIYAFERGLQDIIQITREFEATITQASLIAGDFNKTLEKAALAAKGSIYGPQQLAEMYRELGAAGLNTQQILKTSPDIMDFATAAMIDQAEAAQAVIAAIKSFGLTFDDTREITDAFTEAMNRTTLGGRDLVYALASVGSVAGKFGQSLEQTLAAVAALKDAGASAQDAATSVKSAILALVNPSKEAAEIMDALGIEIYDNSGRMKQWSDIVAEFERGLNGLTEAQKQQYLATIFGNDGIRAILTSLQMGSKHLYEIVRAFEEANGTTQIFALTMAETLDGAIRRTLGNMERLKITIGQDIEPLLRHIIDAIDLLVIGFQSLDPEIRAILELLLGAGGLAVALNTVLRIYNKFKVAISASLGPWGWVAAAITLAGTALAGYKGAQEKARIEQEAHIKTLESQIARIPELQKQYEELINKTNRTAQEEELLRQVTEELISIFPEAVSGFDEMGRAIINTAELAKLAQEEIARLKEEVKSYYQLQAETAKLQMVDIEKRISDLTKKRESLQKVLSSGAQGIPNVWAPGSIISREEIRQELIRINNELREAQEEKFRAEQAINTFERIRKGTYWEQPKETESRARTYTPSSGRTITLSDSSRSKTHSWITTFRNELQAFTSELGVYEMATKRADEAVARLNARQQYLQALLESGKGTMTTYIELEKTRADIIEALKTHQMRLHEEADAYRKALVELNAKQASLNSLLARGKITKQDYVDATQAVRQEIDRLTAAINQNIIAWWQDQRAILEAQQAQEELIRRQVMDISSLLRETYSWEEREQTRRLQEQYDREAKALQERIDLLSEASEKEKRIQEEIAELEEELNEKRNKWAEEDKRRRIEELRGQLESSRMVVVEHGIRRLTHDIEKEKELRDAELEYTRWQEEQKLQARLDRLKEELKAEEEKRRQERERLQKELEDLRESHNQKLEAVREYYAALMQTTILESEARRQILLKGYEQEKKDLEAHLREMEKLQYNRAVETYSSSGGSKSSYSSSWEDALRAAQQKWWDSFAKGDKAGQKAAEELGKAIREAAKKEGVYLPGPDVLLPGVKKPPGFAKGGEVYTSGFAYVHEGETWLTRSLTERLIPLLERIPPSPSQMVTVVTSTTGEVENMGVEAKNLVIKAQAIYIQVNGQQRPNVDVLAQLGIRR
jgi:TP901 family phage tail tape measure protein